ncbi:hypothetical protein [Motiliproteus sp. SC1-56]|uniref:hypothetical protein n=1 Tax=Motiliproteus sp. SC1-56 TaxID=2799565 RepID=UPI001A8F0D1D|nr:hypothetical protein [Motiliproteus sp. SC1-56]
MRVCRRRLLCGWLVLCGWVLSASAMATVEEAVEVLARGEVLSEAQRSELEADADGLFLLGWLHQQGRYGVEGDASRAQDYFLRAAAAGSADVLYYCWQRCLPSSEALERQVAAAASRDHPAALYLHAQALSAQGRQAQADDALLAAARLRFAPALEQLYVEHFLDWSAQRRDYADAEAKLRRCADEGLVVCYYLLGSFFERHRHHDEALEAYQVLALADPELFQRYLFADQLQVLAERQPLKTMSLVRARAAMELIRHPATEFDRLARFQFCADEASYTCAVRLSAADPACLPPLLELAARQAFRASPGYGACLAKGNTTE